MVENMVNNFFWSFINIPVTSWDETVTIGMRMFDVEIIKFSFKYKLFVMSQEKRRVHNLQTCCEAPLIFFLIPKQKFLIEFLGCLETSTKTWLKPIKTPGLDAPKLYDLKIKAIKIRQRNENAYKHDKHYCL